MNINYKKLEMDDFPLLYKWLNYEHVYKWYGKKKPTYDDIKEKYTPYVTKEKPTHSFLIMDNDFPIGYIQTYKINDYIGYAKLIDCVSYNASGVDLFIGEIDYFHKGLGKIIIKKFINEISFNITKTKCCIIGPEPDNLIAIKTYEKVGFKFFKLVQTSESEQEYLMILHKEEL